MIILAKNILDFILGCIDDIFRKLENSFIGNLLCGITFRSRLQTLQVATKKVKIHCTDGFRNDTKVERRRIYKRTSINNVTNFFLTSQPPLPPSQGSSIPKVTTFSQLWTITFSSIYNQKKVILFMDSPKSLSSLVKNTAD